MSQPPLSASSSDNLLYNLSYLSSVIHPVIILRLLEHRLFTPLFKKKSVTKVPSSQSATTATTLILNPTMGAAALGCLPTLPPFVESNKAKRSSQTSLEKPVNTGNLPSTGNANGPDPKDLSLVFSSTGNATRKWFWRTAEKNGPTNGNSVLQTINERTARRLSRTAPEK